MFPPPEYKSVTLEVLNLSIIGDFHQPKLTAALNKPNGRSCALLKKQILEGTLITGITIGFQFLGRQGKVMP